MCSAIEIWLHDLDVDSVSHGICAMFLPVTYPEPVQIMQEHPIVHVECQHHPLMAQ